MVSVKNKYFHPSEISPGLVATKNQKEVGEILDNK
jgi:hypothetical protein